MTEALVRKVDHVFVPVADPAPLFGLFTETLGLPVSWPIHDYGDFVSGGVCVGNANIEFVAGDASQFPFFAPTEPLTVRGIAFEPAGDGIQMDELSERKLRHTDAIAHEGTGARGGSGRLWTNVFLSGMAARAAIVFFCDYHAEESLRHEAAHEAMQESGGGVLGVRELTEIQIGLADRERALPRWEQLMAPIAADKHGRFTMDEGPRIWLKRSPLDAVAGLILAVKSLSAAREALHQRGLLGPSRSSGVGLNYAYTGGLDVWLTEAR